MEKSSFFEFYIKVVGFLSDNLVLGLIVLFAFAAFTRVLIHMMVRRQMWFINEFQKRVRLFLGTTGDKESTNEDSFFSMLKYNLEKTYFELFRLREKFHRRTFDKLFIIWDKMFFIQKGAAEFIVDFLHQVRFLKQDRSEPQFIDKTKASFNNNKTFGKLFGFLPVTFFDDTLHKLPSIFVIGGIFGTFLGIMHALPELSRIDIANPEESRKIMNQFLLNISFAMNTSIVGIIFSVCMSFLNSTLSPDNMYYHMVNDFSSSVDILWNKSRNNNLTPTEVDLFESALPIKVKGRFLDIPAEKILKSSTTKFEVMRDQHIEEEQELDEEEESEQDKSA
ncbi:MAG: hypothetical protein ACO20H_13265 [Bacteriovoracaceae bacterium]